MTRTNIVAIASMDAEGAAKRLEDASLEDRARAAFKAARSNWLAPTEEEAFAAGCEGLARTATEDELDRIKDDLERANKVGSLLNALGAGVPIDWDALEAPEPPENPLGLNKLWREVAAP